MTISATIAIADMETANAELDAAGHGPSNFSVPLRTGNAAATHAGLHTWDDAGFLAALQALSVPVKIRSEPGRAVNFPSHVQAEALEWSDPTTWFESPVMAGDTRTRGGRTWRSLVDVNVWEPPVGWREVVEDGPAAWVQPTGAHDAYAAGATVTHNGATWANTHGAGNVWEPGVYGWAQA